MRLSIQKHIVDIEDKYIEYSPLLKSMKDTDIPVDLDDNGAIILDVELSSFKQYRKFLQGKIFHMDEDIALLFDYMGHSNEMDYTLDVWAMKLHDNWVRDNMYRHELWEDPLYDLVQLPVVRKCPIEVPDEWFIAGGAALWIGGFIDKLADIDCFTCMSKEDAQRSLLSVNSDSSLKLYNIFVSGHSVSYYISTKDDVYKVQHILRIYKSPSEIIHGFDLDCVGCIYIPESNTLWCTRRTAKSLLEKTNWFDPTRASPSYVYRLIKYRHRGFKIHLPLITTYDTDEKKINEYKDKIKDLYDNEASENFEILPLIKPGAILYRINAVLNMESRINGMIHMESNDLFDKIKREITSQFDVPVHRMFRCVRHKVDFIPNDDVSRLILASLYDLYVTYGKYKHISDYETKKEEYQIVYDRYNEIDFSNVQWKEQSPMEQVTSTCIPTPIDDLIKWYKSSPLVTME